MYNNTYYNTLLITYSQETGSYYLNYINTERLIKRPPSF